MNIAAGIDWGRHNDPSSLTRVDFSDPYNLRVTYARRFPARGQPWPLIVDPIRRETQGCRPVLSDGTGVGDALTDQIPGAIGIVLVANSGYNGDKPIKLLKGKRVAVPTEKLFAPLIQAINCKRLTIDCHTDGLKGELINFAVKFGRKGGMGYGARSGHDDQVFSLALAVYGATYLLLEEQR